MAVLELAGGVDETDLASDIDALREVSHVGPIAATHYQWHLLIRTNKVIPSTKHKLHCSPRFKWNQSQEVRREQEGC